MLVSVLIIEVTGKILVSQRGFDFLRDQATDQHGLRYGEFIAPLIKAIQELAARVESLEAQIGTGGVARGADRRQRDIKNPAAVLTISNRAGPC